MFASPFLAGELELPGTPVPGQCMEWAEQGPRVPSPISKI